MKMDNVYLWHMTNDYLYAYEEWLIFQFSSDAQPWTLFVAPWTTACQVSLFITNSWSLLRLMSIELVMISNHFIWCHPLLFLPSVFLSIRSFLMNQFFPSGGQIIGVSVSASVLPMNSQYCFPLGLTGWISLQPKALSRVFSNTTVQKHQFFDAQLSLWSNSHIHTWLLEKP